MKKKKNIINQVIIYSFLLIGVMVMLGPMIWMVLSSFKTASEIVQRPPTFFPVNPTLNNFKSIFDRLPFALFYTNSLAIASIVALVTLFTSALLGYIFEKFQFKMRNILFILVLCTIMIPLETKMIPLYLMFDSARLIDTYAALILPPSISAFGVYLMKQFIHGISNDLMDSARIDGSSEFGIFLRIILPLAKPALGALGIFAFMANWNSYLWPLIAINSTSRRTLPIGLAMVTSAYGGTQYGPLMASVVLAIIPVIIVFLFLQRHFVGGITLTGLKG